MEKLSLKKRVSSAVRRVVANRKVRFGIFFIPYIVMAVLSALFVFIITMVGLAGIVLMINNIGGAIDPATLKVKITVWIVSVLTTLIVLGYGINLAVCEAKRLSKMPDDDLKEWLIGRTIVTVITLVVATVLFAIAHFSGLIG